MFKRENLRGLYLSTSKPVNYNCKYCHGTYIEKCQSRGFVCGFVYYDMCPMCYLVSIGAIYFYLNNRDSSLGRIAVDIIDNLGTYSTCEQCPSLVQCLTYKTTI